MGVEVVHVAFVLLLNLGVLESKDTLVSARKTLALLSSDSTPDISRFSPLSSAGRVSVSVRSGGGGGVALNVGSGSVKCRFVIGVMDTMKGVLESELAETGIWWKFLDVDGDLSDCCIIPTKDAVGFPLFFFSLCIF